MRTWPSVGAVVRPDPCSAALLSPLQQPEVDENWGFSATSNDNGGGVAGGGQRGRLAVVRVGNDLRRECTSLLLFLLSRPTPSSLGLLVLHRGFQLARRCGPGAAQPPQRHSVSYIVPRCCGGTQVASCEPEYAAERVQGRTSKGATGNWRSEVRMLIRDAFVA